VVWKIGNDCEWIYREYPANGVEAADRVRNDGTNSYHIGGKELKNSEAGDKMIFTCRLWRWSWNNLQQ